MPERSGGKTPKIHRWRRLDFRSSKWKTPETRYFQLPITEKALISRWFFAVFFGQACKNPRIS